MNEPVRFNCDGTGCIWPLPWTVASPADLVVTIQPSGGLERRLDPARDYSLLSGNVLMCVAPAGSVLACWPARTAAYPGITGQGQAGAQVPGPQGSAASQVAASAGQSGQSGNWANAAGASGPVYLSDGQSLDKAASQSVALLEARAGELRADMADAMRGLLTDAMREVTGYFRERLETALAELEKARQDGRAEARLATACAAQREYMLLPSGCARGAYLTLPVAYMPGTSTLGIYLAGALLKPGHDYEEIGRQNEVSRTIRMLLELAPESELDCLVQAIASSDAARQSAQAAQQAQEAAASLLADARAAQSDASQSLARSGNDAITAQGWANASRKSADDAWEASCHAWDAATQASIHARRPGICAVKSMEDIHACSPGLFIINPHITHAPTPFFGVWPAEDLEHMAWDGVFFLGGKPWPDDPALPPRCPAKPEAAPVAATGGADDWIPCGHVHPQQPRACDCCPSLCPGKANIDEEASNEPM